LHPETLVSRHFDSELISCTLIRDEAMGLAAQQAVSDYGADADWENPAIHTVLCELRKDGYR